MNPHFAIREGLAFGDLAVKSGLILVAGWFVTLALRKVSAASRHLVWLATFCAMLLLPLVMMVVPSKPLAVVHEKPRVIAAPVPATLDRFSDWTPSVAEIPSAILEPLPSPTDESSKTVTATV